MKLKELQAITDAVHGNSPADQALLYDRMRQLGMDPGNFYQELEMESVTVDTHRDVSWSNTQMNLHSHNFVEILYCTNTCGVEYLVGAERYRLQKGDVVMVPPGVSHRPLLPEEMTEPYTRDVLWVNPDFLDKMMMVFPPDWMDTTTEFRLLRTAGTKWEFLGELFRAGVVEAEQKRGGWNAFITGNAMQILVCLGRAIQDRTADDLQAETPELVDRIFAYIEENLEGRITLADTARRFYVSESTVSHLFKQKMGVSFYRHVTQRRLIAAKTLIEKGVALEEVSLQTGFTDYSAFYRAFRQEFGISPRQYRKMQAPPGQESI